MYILHGCQPTFRFFYSRDNQRVKDMMIGAVSGAILEKGLEKYRDHREHKKASSSKGD